MCNERNDGKRFSQTHVISQNPTAKCGRLFAVARPDNVVYEARIALTQPYLGEVVEST
jgi:hypothetical protein